MVNILENTGNYLLLLNILKSTWQLKAKIIILSDGVLMYISEYVRQLQHKAGIKKKNLCGWKCFIFHIK